MLTKEDAYKLIDLGKPVAYYEDSKDPTVNKSTYQLPNGHLILDYNGHAIHEISLIGSTTRSRLLIWAETKKLS